MFFIHDNASNQKCQYQNLHFYLVVKSSAHLNLRFPDFDDIFLTNNGKKNTRLFTENPPNTVIYLYIVNERAILLRQLLQLLHDK